MFLQLPEDEIIKIKKSNPHLNEYKKKEMMRFRFICLQFVATDDNCNISREVK